MQCNRNIVRVKQLLQCDTNSRDGEQYKRICLWIVYSILIMAQCGLECSPLGMCIRDCQFLTYLQTGCATATKWMTFKNQRRAHFYLSAPTHLMQMSHKISGVTGPKFTNFFTRRRGIIVDVNATINVAIYPSIVECQCTDWRRVCQFSPTCPTNRSQCSTVVLTLL